MQIGNIKVEFRISPGRLYFLDFFGAIGKTYLFGLLKRHTLNPEYKKDILLLTYTEKFDSVECIGDIDAFTGKIIFADRFDLYGTKEILDSIYKNGATAFVDTKDPSYALQYKGIGYAEVYRTKDKVEVVEI